MFMHYFMGGHVVLNKHQCSPVTIHAKCGRAGHHQPLRVWVLCLYFMGLNVSNRQIALELGLDASDTQAMTEQLSAGLAAKAPAVELKGEVEIDEVYVVAAHKG